jgi:site-specific DNA recombinase
VLRNNHLNVVPEEEEINKRIYPEYLEYASMLKIKRGLETDGMLNGAGNEKTAYQQYQPGFTKRKVYRHALLQKTYATDFLTKTRVKNHKVIVYEDEFTVIRARRDGGRGIMRL